MNVRGTPGWWVILALEGRMTKLEIKPLSWLKPDPDQPRKQFPEDDLRQLGESLRAGQLQPCLCLSDGTIVAGERRWRAANLVGLETLEVKIIEPKSDTEKRRMQIVENMQRADLSGFEQWMACVELLAGNPEWTFKELAQCLSLSPSSVTKIMASSKLTLAWREALRDGKVTLSDCYAASRLPDHEQGGLLALKLSGASRDDLEKATRKLRGSAAPVARLSRVRCPLAGSTTVVTVTGDDLSLGDLIESMEAALDCAKKASKEKLDIRTAEKVWRDKAKA